MFIKLKKISKRYYDKVLIKDLDILISGDRKIGLIGDNGSGKTTLLKIIASIETPNQGTIEVSPPDTRFAYIMSDHDLLESYDHPYEFMLPEDLVELYEKIFVEQTQDQDVYAAFDELNGYSVLNEVEKHLNKFDIKITDLTQSFEHLSSGERLKMQFAKISANPYDALLLDEPTATLDRNGKKFLYDFLKQWHQFCIIASHDRKILNQFCKQILVMENTEVKSYSGNYDFYIKTSTEDRNRVEEENTSFKRQIYSLSAESENIAEDINERVRKPRDNDKLTFNYKVLRKSSKGMRKVEVLNNRIGRIKSNIVELPERNMEETNLRVVLEAPKSKTIITAKDLKIEIEGKVILENANFTIGNKDRILLEGINGTGKSSLIKAIYHGTNVVGGEIIKSDDLEIGYFEQTLNQGILFIEAEDYVIGGRDWIKEDRRINELADYFNFSKSLFSKPLKDLSEGEKAKLKIIKVLSYNPNFLIFDEPTNFLDLHSLEKMQAVINKTNIPMIIVSHDDEFNETLNINKLWRIDSGILKQTDFVREEKPIETEPEEELMQDEDQENA
jgi:ATPase subunit of ABC transporter with duplicated ATPase domains